MSYYRRYGRRLVDAGYPAIPVLPGQKRPGICRGREQEPLTSWNRFCREMPDEHLLDEWESGDASVGIACGAFVVAVDIDVVDTALSIEIQRKVLEITGADEAPTRTGRYPKAAMIFRPGDEIKTESKKFTHDGVVHGIDILSFGRQFVAYGIHPDTGREYVWRDGAPDLVEASRLPVITQDHVRRILAVCAGAQVPEARADSAARAAAGASAGAPASREAARWFAENLPNNETTTWDEWRRIGLALYEATKPDAVYGRSLWHIWSGKNPKYNARETDRAWDTFVRDSKGLVGVGTLMDRVARAGLKLPPEISLIPDIPETAAFEFVVSDDRVTRGVVDHEAPMPPDERRLGLTPAEFALYLRHIYRGTEADDSAGIERIYKQRCYGHSMDVSADQQVVDALRAKVLNNFGEVAISDHRRVNLVTDIQSAEQREHDIQTIVNEYRGSLGSAAVSHAGRTVQMRPQDKPLLGVAGRAWRYAPEGLIEEFARYVQATSSGAVRELAVQAGAALTAVLIGCAVRSPSNIRPNVYMLGLGKSGVGKNAGGDAIIRTLNEAGLRAHHILGSNVSSSAAIRNAFLAAAGPERHGSVPALPGQSSPSPAGHRKDKDDGPDGTSMSKIIIHEEFGALWRSLSVKGNVHGAQLLGDFMSFYSAANKIMPATIYADRRFPGIPYPHLTIHAVATPDSIMDSIRPETLREGHINRFLLVEVDDHPSVPTSHDRDMLSGKHSPTVVPDRLLKMVLALKSFSENTIGLVPNPWIDSSSEIGFTPDALDAVLEIKQLERMCYAEAAKNPALVVEPFTRLTENSIRLAMLSAMSRVAMQMIDGAQVTPTMTRLDVEWGFSCVRYCAERVSYVVGSETAASDGATAEVDRVYSLIRRSGVAGITRTELSQGIRLPKQRRAAALNALIDGREIVAFRARPNGRGPAEMRMWATTFLEQAQKQGHIPQNWEMIAEI